MFKNNLYGFVSHEINACLKSTGMRDMTGRYNIVIMQVEKFEFIFIGMNIV